MTGSSSSSIRDRLLSSEWVQRALLRLRAFHADALFTFLARRMSGRFGITARCVMVIAPHQDDETFGCGGLIALKRQRGVEVQVVFLTDGGNSPLAPDGAIVRTDLAPTRLREAREAISALGVPDSDVHFLGFPDSELATLPEQRREEIIEQLRALIVTHRPHEVLVPHHDDGHGDHEAAYGFTVEAVRRTGRGVHLLQYSIWRPWLHPLSRPSWWRDMSTAVLLSVAPVMGKKNAAIAAYSSQLATLPPGFINRFHRPYEVYFPVKDSVASASEKVMQVVGFLVCLLGTRTAEASALHELS